MSDINCPRCNREGLTRDDFGNNKRRATGFSLYCKKCVIDINKDAKAKMKKEKADESIERDRFGQKIINPKSCDKARAIYERVMGGKKRRQGLGFNDVYTVQNRFTEVRSMPAVRER